MLLTIASTMSCNSEPLDSSFGSNGLHRDSMTISSQSLIEQWNSFKKSYVSDDGRIIDYHQNISHSEGQGYGLLLSTQVDDTESFNLIWNWTKANLQRADKLFAWSWRCLATKNQLSRTTNDNCAVADNNNATDGDILIAYSLILAANRWSNPELLEHALKILQAVQNKLARTVNGKVFLLPGEFGFEEKKLIKLNPSYQILSAYQLFADYHEKAFWTQIAQDATWLIKHSFHPNYNLPADWVWISKESGEVVKLGKQFGYEAIRVYLYQLWQNPPPDYYPSYLLELFEKQFWLYSQLDFKRPHKKYPYEALSGIYLIYSKIAALCQQNSLSKQLKHKAQTKHQLEKRQYYGQVLYLLAQVTP